MRLILKRQLGRMFWSFVAFLLLAGMTAAIVCVMKLRSPFNEAVYGRIELGMTVDEVTAILGMSPGYHDVSKEEQFVNMSHKGKIVFGNEHYQDREKEPAIVDIVCRETGKPAATLRKWVNAENGVFVLTQDENVIGAMYVVSLTSFNRSKWLTDLRRRLGL